MEIFETQTNTHFTVNNGVWDREVFGKDVNIQRESYDFSVQGGCTSHLFYNPLDPAINQYALHESGSRDHIVTTTNEWMIDQSGVKHDHLSFTTNTTDKKKDAFFSTSSGGTNSGNSWSSQKFEQDYTFIENMENTLGVATTTFTISGVASGKREIVSQHTPAGMYDVSVTEEFKNGIIFRDPATNEITGRSMAKTDYTTSSGTQSLGFIPVNHNDFISYTNFLTEHPNKIIIRDFAEPHELYLDTFTGYSGSVTLDFEGNGIGVTFGEAEPIDPAIFDSGIEKFLPEQKVPTYEPMDTSGVTLINPNELPDFLKSPHLLMPDERLNPGGIIGKDIKNAYIARGILGLGIFRMYNSFTTYGGYQYTDDGNIEIISAKARKQFLIDYFYKMCQQSQIEEGQTYMVEIPTWTSIWETIPKRDKNGGVGGIDSFDFTTNPEVDPCQRLPATATTRKPSSLSCHRRCKPSSVDPRSR